MKQLKLLVNRTCLTLIFLMALSVARAADYYWIGGSGTWNDLTHWATTSGGSTNPLIVPSAADNVIFDANSFPGSAKTVTISFEASCKNFTVAAGVGTGVIFQFNAGLVASGTISVAGGSLITWNQQNKLNAVNGVSFSNVKFTMSSGEFKVTGGNLTLLDGADFTKNGSDLLHITAGTISVDGSSKFVQNSGTMTVGAAITVPSGATFTSSASDKTIAGGIELQSGSKGNLSGIWRIQNGGFQIDDASTVVIQTNLQLYLNPTTSGIHYLKCGGRDLRRIEISYPNYNAEYHLTDKLIAKGSGVFIYANKFLTDGNDMDIAQFQRPDYYYVNNVYTPSTQNSTINFTNSEVSVLYEVNLGNNTPPTFISTGSTITFNGNSYQQFYAPRNSVNDLVFNNGSNSQIYIYVDNNNSIRDITINASGTPYLSLQGNKTIRNFTFNNLNNSSSGTNWQEIHGTNVFTGTFTYTTVNPDVRHKFYTSRSNTFNILNWNSSISDWKIGSGYTQTITDLKPIQGTCARTVSIYSSNAGSQGYISQASGSVLADWVFLQDIHKQGSAVFTATNAVNGGNNNGWTITGIPAQNFYWIGGAGNWNDPAHWSLSSGGPAGCAIPSRIDNVFFDANSFTASGQYCMINVAADCKSMTWNNTQAGAGLNGSSDLNIYGSLKLASSMNYQFNGRMYFQSNTSGNTLETAGKTILGQLWFMGQNSSSGVWTLVDPLTSNSNVYPYYGKLITAGNNISAYSLEGGAIIDFTGTSLVQLQYYCNIYGNLIPATVTTEFKLEGNYFNYFYAQNGKVFDKVTINNTDPYSGQVHIYLYHGSEIKNLDINYGGMSRVYLFGYGLNNKIGNLDIDFTNPNLQTNGSVEFEFNSLTVNQFNFKSSGQIRPSVIVRPYQYISTNTIHFNNFSLENAGEWVLGGGTKTFGNISIKGSCLQKTVFRNYDNSGTANMINCSGTATADHCVLKDVTITGGGTYSATNSINGGNVTGWPVVDANKNFYWVGGAGNWNDPNHWSLSSGGAAAGCIPSQADNVFFDVNSFSAANQYVSVNVPAYFKNMVWQNVNQPILYSYNNMNCYGSLELAANMQWQQYSNFYFQSRNTGNTIRTNGRVMNSVYFNGDNSVLGGWELEDDFTSNSSVFHNAGSFKTNGYKFTAYQYINNVNNSSLSIDFTGSEVVINNQFTLQPLVNYTGTNAQISFVNTSNISFNGGNKTFHNLSLSPSSTSSTIILNGNNTYNNLSLATAGYPNMTINGNSIFNDINASFSNNSGNVPVMNFTGSNTVNTMTVSSTGLGSPYITLAENNNFNSLIASGLGTRLYIGANKTQTVNGLLALGNGNYPVIFQSTTTGVQGTIFKPSGKVCLDYVQMRDIRANGSAQFFAGTGSVNVGNNTNWTFASCEAYYWVGDNGNWSDYANHWARTSGGTVFHDELPGPEDDVIFDANSFTIAGRTVNIDVPLAQAKNMKWSSASFTPTLTGSGIVEIYGDLEFTVNMNQNHTGSWKFKGNNNNNIINPTGKSLPNMSIEGGFDGQGKWTLQNPLVVSNDLQLLNGTLATNNKAVTTKNFSSTGSSTRSLQLGSSLFTISNGSWNAGTLNNTSLVEGTSTIMITGNDAASFTGNGLTYANLSFEGAPSLNAQLSGNNIINTLTVKPGVLLQLAAGSTQTISALVANGFCSTPIQLFSSAPGTASHLVKSSGSVNVKFAGLKDIHASGGATFNAIGSANISGNSGWNFAAATPMSATLSAGYVSCTANNDGSASVATITGGEAPYSYLWSNTLTTQSISNLIPGNYSVTITDALGCTLVKNIDVTTTPGGITAVPFNASDLDICLGTSISFTAGSPVEEVSSYRWNFGDFTTGNQVNHNKTYSAAGTYQVTLSYIDANGCPSNTSATVRVSNVLVGIASTNVSCRGDNNGTITLTPSGGFAPYQYSINGGTDYTSSASFTNLAPGDYQVRVKDALGCESSIFNRSISQPTASLSFTKSSSGLACPSNNNGVISFTASGGTAPYSYSINNGVSFFSTSVFDDLAAGSYQLVVRDSRGCLTAPQTVSFAQADLTLPSISCPSNISVSTSSGCSKAVVVPAPVVSDNCGVESVVNNFNLTSNASGTYPVGTTNVTWMVRDVNGNINTCTMTVTVTENVPPVATCRNINVQLNSSGAATITAADINNNSYDACSAVQTEIQSGRTSFTCADVNQTFPVVLLVTDGQGNTSSCTAQVTVKDDLNPCNQAPVAACRNITVSANGQCNASVTGADINNGSSDPDDDALSFSLAPAGPYPLGTTQVTLTVSDGKGKSDQCQATITVVDNTPPDFDCPGPQNVNLTSSCKLVVPNLLGSLGASDNCGTTIASQSPLAGTELSSSHNQTHNVIITVSDGSGNSSSCTVILTAKDVTPPSFTCPSNQDVSLGSNCKIIIPNLATPLAGTGLDNCGTVSFTQLPVAGTEVSSSHHATHTVIVTASDGNGNTSTCSITITAKDQTNPTVTCPGNINEPATTGTCGKMVSYAVPFSDNCAGSGIEQLSGLASGSVFPVGITTNSFRVTDAAGNTATCSFTVTISDNEPPTVTCPSDVSVNTNTGVCGAQVNYAPPQVSDNCSGNGNYVQTSCTYSLFNMSDASLIVNGDDNLSGAITLPFSFSFYGNSFSQVFASTNGFISLGAAPSVGQGCCSGRTLPNADFQNSIALSWMDWVPNVRYKLFGSAPNRIVVFDWNGYEFGNGGQILDGQIALYETTNQIRLITRNITNFGHTNTQGLNKDGSTAHAVAGRNATVWSAASECILFTPGVSITQTSGLPSGSVFPVGTTTNAFTVSDMAGNTSNCSFTVTVTDNEAPEITCPANISANAPVGTCAATVTFNAAVTDNCSATVKYYLNYGTPTQAEITSPRSFPVGNYTVTAVARDASLNSDDCSFTVTVLDAEPPTVRTKNISVQLDVTGSATINGADVDNGSTDPCGIATRTVSPSSFNCTDIGANTVTLTVTDVNGNSSTATATVTITALQTTTNVTVTPSTQQYSDLVDFEATLSPGSVEGDCVPATSVTFRIGNQDMGTANLVLGEDGLLHAYLDDVALFETPDSYELSPGTKTVTAVFNGVGAAFLVTNPTTTLEITRENARADYTGASFVGTSSATSSTATVTLSATIRDITAVNAITDPHRGDIRKARVKFVNRDDGTDISGWLTPGLVTPGDIKTGSVNFNWSASIGNDNARQFTIGIIVEGMINPTTNAYYIRNNSEDNAVVTVAKPLNDFITGGGYLVLSNSGGMKAGDEGTKNNFGFNVKYNKSQTNLQGNINTIFRRMETDGILHVYQIKGNVMTSLSAISATSTSPGKATFNGKANIQDITDPLNPVPIQGGAILQMIAHDRGEPGTWDDVALTLWDKDGGLWFSTNWNGVRTEQQVIDGGNIRVNAGAATPGTMDNTVTLSASLPTSSQGMAVTFRATITESNSATPTGYVSFLDGNTVLAYAPVSTTGGVTSATLTTSSLTAGSHNIRAVYSGDNKFACRQSAVLIHVVYPAAPVTRVDPKAQQDDLKVHSLELTAWPNPSQSVFQIRVRSTDPGSKISVRITDMSGRVITAKQVSSGQVITAGTNFIAGLYVVDVMQGDQRRSMKLVKQ